MEADAHVAEVYEGYKGWGEYRNHNNGWRNKGSTDIGCASDDAR